MLSAIHQNYLQSVNNLSIKNIGLTGKNPSVACLIVDYSKSPKGIVLSYGLTSKNGRPHAEINALNKLSKKEINELTITTDANWAGDKKTRKSTSGGTTISIGKHLIKTCPRHNRI